MLTSTETQPLPVIDDEAIATFVNEMLASQSHLRALDESNATHTTTETQASDITAKTQSDTKNVTRTSMKSLKTSIKSNTSKSQNTTRNRKKNNDE
jgi:hypothetical protein